MSSRVALGFTLIELIVVLAMASLILALVPGAYSRLKESADYRSDVLLVVSSARSARAESMRSGRAVTLSVDPQDRRITVGARRPEYLSGAVDVRLTVARRYSDERVGRIAFHPDGSSSGGSIDLIRRTGQGVRVRVDWLLGRVEQEPIASQHE